MATQTQSGEIQWREWSDAAFAEAQSADKPVLLDISAVWCHWCHEMDRNTYSDAEVRRLVTELYVPVRVENDARPDINERYNQGGWPTTAFLTPTGEVIYGATYIPPEQMRRALVEVSRAYTLNKDQLQRQIAEIRARRSEPRPTPPDGLPDTVVADVLHAIRRNFDPQHGGFGTQPKFPVPDAVLLALQQHILTGDEALLALATKTLDGMIGLYDQVDGGFHRYSVTPDWTVPHYEKMLEGNAGLAVAYAAGYLVTREERYAEALRGTLGYMLRVLHGEDGGFYGSQDADVNSHDEEAQFVTGEEYFPLGREERTRIGTPYVDKTVYSGWNGMCVTALVEGHRALGDGVYLREAEKTADMLLTTGANSEGAMWRVVGNPDSTSGMLGDQVQVARGLLSLHEATGEGRYLDGARRVIGFAQAQLTDSLGGGFYDKPEAANALGALAERRKDLPDNALAAQVLLRLHLLTGEESYRSEAELSLRAFADQYHAYGYFAGGYAQAVQMLLRPVHITVLGPVGDAETEARWEKVYHAFDPGAVREREAGEDAVTRVCIGTECRENRGADGSPYPAFDLAGVAG
jgi:uncharacterized protein